MSQKFFKSILHTLESEKVEKRVLKMSEEKSTSAMFGMKENQRWIHRELRRLQNWRHQCLFPEEQQEI